MDLIGEGGVWKVFKIDTKDSVFRTPKDCLQKTIDRFIENHRLIKNLGLPTLKKVETYKILGEIGIICENVNCSEKEIYVSHNTLYSDSQKMVYLLSKNILKDRIEKQSSFAEEFRYKHKLDELTNFEKFLDGVTLDLKLATTNCISIEFDAYFFGTQKYESISCITYKLVDLDHVSKVSKKNKSELYENNISEFMTALSGFIKYFINENTRKKYEDYVKNYYS